MSPPLFYILLWYFTESAGFVTWAWEENTEAPTINVFLFRYYATLICLISVFQGHFSFLYSALLGDSRRKQIFSLSWHSSSQNVSQMREVSLIGLERDGIPSR